MILEEAHACRLEQLEVLGSIVATTASVKVICSWKTDF